MKKELKWGLVILVAIVILIVNPYLNRMMTVQLFRAGLTSQPQYCVTMNEQTICPGDAAFSEFFNCNVLGCPEGMECQPGGECTTQNDSMTLTIILAVIMLFILLQK